MVLPGKAVVFAASRANAAPLSAPPEAFVVGGGGFGSATNAEKRRLMSVPSLTGMLASFTSAFRPELARSLTLAVPSAIPAAAPFMPSAGAFDLAKLRLNAKNATGGTDLYSQNFGWGTSLIGLSGRAGLDAGFGMSYNSLVWLKDTTNSEIIFDPDTSKVSPGFMMGFSDIEPAYYDTDKSVYVFLMVNPDGSRTEFRRVGTSDVFDAADSSYRQLVINPGGVPDGKSALIDMTVISTSGTRMHYIWRSQVKKYQCEEIKDRNGNYITINYTNGRMTSLSDTLGRVVTVNYDSGNYPISITQTWKDANGGGSNNLTHTWAAFGYTNATVSTNFSGLTVIGPANSSTVKVLEKITYSDSSFTKFEYNGYLQVKKISNIAADSTSHVLNYVSTNLDSISVAQTDCPRLTTTRSWAENFNSGAEVVVNNTLTTGQTYTLPDSSTVTGTKIEIKSPDSNGTADALVTRIFSASSGWAEGLPVVTEDYATESSSLVKKRWTWTNYTQENTSAGYIQNPRVMETKVGDTTNTKRSKIYYLMASGGSTVTQYGLVSSTEVYDSDQSTILKTQTTDYNLGSNYTSRRIIGLPSETKLYEGTTSGSLMSKVTYGYDQNGYTATGQSVCATSHDATNYGTALAYRGNLTSTKRWDVTVPTTSGAASESTVVHNITGSPI